MTVRYICRPSVYIPGINGAASRVSSPLISAPFLRSVGICSPCVRFCALRAFRAFLLPCVRVLRFSPQDLAPMISAALASRIDPAGTAAAAPCVLVCACLSVRLCVRVPLVCPPPLLMP